LKALIDGDIVTFRAAFSAEEETESWVAQSRADKIVEDILGETDSDSYEVWISGDNNFRYQVYPEYKINRHGARRPKWEHEVKDYLVRVWDSQVSNGCEADDMMGVRQCENTDETIICTIDKDLDMIPGWHWNFVKKIKYYVTDEEAIRFFYYQMLVGDPTDGIKGVPGIGKVKAEKLLRGVLTEELFQTVRDQYGSDEEMELNGQCLWIWRKPNDIWKLPLNAI
jgi:DNA polymerase-1